MWKFDLLYNIFLVAIDLFFLVFFRRMLIDGKIRTGLKQLAYYIASGICLALFMRLVCGLRIFAAMRFSGQFIFLHMPVTLVICAVISKKFKLASRLCFASGTVLFLTYLYAYHVEPYWLEVTHYEYSDPKLAGLERPIVIAQVSDLQVDKVGAYESRVLHALKESNPDMIIYTGDYAQHNKREEYRQLASNLNKLLRDTGLSPPYGSYAVNGDCESVDAMQSIFRDLPVQILDNDTKEVRLPGVTVHLMGMNCACSKDYKPNLSIPFLMKKSKTRLNIIFGHSPNFTTLLKGWKEPFLAMAGHTHGGQFQAPFFGPPFYLSRVERKFADGFLPFGRGVISVSRGIGMERMDAPRLRFLCRPELRFITLTPSEE